MHLYCLTNLINTRTFKAVGIVNTDQNVHVIALLCQMKLIYSLRTMDIFMTLHRFLS